MSTTLHGSAPDTCPVALLLVDVINPFDFEGGEILLERAGPTSERIEALAARCRSRGVPVIYANDNFGRWRSAFAQVLERCTHEGCPGAEIAQRLQPEDDDYLVLKAKNSAFFHTTLELLLRALGTETLILCGWQTDNCVLFTANAAYLREYQLVVPEDGCASENDDRHRHAIALMERTLKARTTPTETIDLDPLMASP